VAAIASPFDFTRVRLMAPFRADLTNGALVSAAYRLLGGAPARSCAMRTRPPPWTSRSSSPGPLTHLDDREFWPRSRPWTRSWPTCTPTRGARSASSTTASSASTSSPRQARAARAYGRPRRRQVSVLAVAGASDGIAPRGAVFRVGDLLPNAPDAARTAPGGHLGGSPARPAARPGSTWTSSSLGRLARSRRRQRRRPSDERARGCDRCVGRWATARRRRTRFRTGLPRSPRW
jgi:hypothetical protein